MDNQIYLIGVIWLLTTLLGVLRLARNWYSFGSRSWPMLIVALFLPFGGLWPMFASADETQASKGDRELDAARRMNEAYARGNHHEGDYWAMQLA